MIVWNRPNLRVVLIATVALVLLDTSLSYANGWIGGVPSWWKKNGCTSCQKHSTGVMPFGAMPGYHMVGAAPISQPGCYPNPSWGAPVAQRVLPRTPDAPPPPGTLGQTYNRTSQRIPWDKHPRTGMVEIEIDRAALVLEEGVEIKVTVQDVNENFKPLDGFLGDDGKWHFESEPLYPGNPHIYHCIFEVIRVTTRSDRVYGQRIESQIEETVRNLGVKTIRLIPGRIVDLKFVTPTS